MADAIPLVAPQDVIDNLTGIINFGEGSGSRFGERSGGIVFDLSLLTKFQLRAEAMVNRRLSTLYALPLTSTVNGGQTLEDFETNTRYSLESLFITATSMLIVSFVFSQQGNSVQLRNYLNSLEARYQENMELSLEKNEDGGGRVFPAYPDLLLSNMYLTRGENPIPEMRRTDNMYMPYNDAFKYI